jgi:phosphoribosylanthranilate isomerase
MKTKIKICGLTTKEAVLAAINGGADMLGFVFVESSPRYISPKQARALIDLIPSGIDSVAVMLHPTQDEVNTVLHHLDVSYLQTDANDFDSIDLKTSVQSLRVYRDSEVFDPKVIDDNPFALFEGPLSGTGNLVNLERSKKACDLKKVILAGGLDSKNLKEVLNHVRPFGVDVSTGVEVERGTKSKQKIIEFIRMVRAFDEEINNG